MGMLMTGSEDTALSVTDSAVKKVRDLKREEGNDALLLRVYITGGGCAGFSYGFQFDESVREDDTIISREDVTVVVDAMSIQYLAGSEVDYTEGLQGARFLVRNPNASSTCGCGSSFSI